jgi:hypothetical protein
MSLKESISADNNTDEEKEGITEYGDHDVLLGRGGVTNNHPGNIHFRQIVEDHKETYKAAPQHRKMQLAKDIVSKWRDQSPPGRFLKKMDNGNGWHWYDVGDDKARKITSQKLREQAKLSEGNEKNDIGFLQETSMEACQRLLVVQKKKNDPRLTNMVSSQNGSKPVWMSPPQLMNPRPHVNFKAQPNTHPGWRSLHANTESQQYNGFQAQQDNVGRLNSLGVNLLSHNNTLSSITYAALRSSILNGKVLPKKRKTNNQNESNDVESQAKRPNRQQLRVSPFDA